jgi:hypothetical protein
MAGELARLLGVLINNNKNSVIGLHVALPAAYWEAHDEVHRIIRPWATLLRQRLHASVLPMLHRTHALAGQAGPGIGLDLARHTWPVILPGH